MKQTTVFSPDGEFDISDDGYVIKQTTRLFQCEIEVPHCSDFIISPFIPNALSNQQTASAAIYVSRNVCDSKTITCILVQETKENEISKLQFIQTSINVGALSKGSTATVTYNPDAVKHLAMHKDNKLMVLDHANRLFLYQLKNDGTHAYVTPLRDRSSGKTLVTQDLVTKEVYVLDSIRGLHVAKLHDDMSNLKLVGLHHRCSETDVTSFAVANGVFYMTHVHPGALFQECRLTITEGESCRVVPLRSSHNILSASCIIVTQRLDIVIYDDCSSRIHILDSQMRRKAIYYVKDVIALRVWEYSKQQQESIEAGRYLRTEMLLCATINSIKMFSIPLTSLD